jgi:PAS domain S-box-containing protein
MAVRVMKERDLYDLLMGGGDPGFVTASDGVIRIWNHGAEALFGIPAAEALDKRCDSVLEGQDARGNSICTPDCRVLEMAGKCVPVPSFDVKVKTRSGGRRWVNVSILQCRTVSGELLVVHLLRDIHSHKILESMTEKFLTQVGSLTGRDVASLLSPAPAPHFALTERELEILRLLARGMSTSAVSRELSISEATARNHIQHVLEKLSAHSRTEAVLRALSERLI